MMNTAARRIIGVAGRYARSWEQRNCNKAGKETCAALIRQEFFGQNSYGTPWCAMFVWVVADEVFGESNPLLKTASTVAMRNAARANDELIVDKKPALGSVFFRYRTGGGHVGYVVKIDSNNDSITTIEGNSSNAVGGRSYKKSQYAGWDFIHVESVAAKRRTWPIVVAGATAMLGAGAYMAYRKEYI